MRAIDCSAPGNNETTGGSAADQPPASPSTCDRELVHDRAVLRTRISAVACAPGATATGSGPKICDRTHSSGV